MQARLNLELGSALIVHAASTFPFNRACERERPCQARSSS